VVTLTQAIAAGGVALTKRPHHGQRQQSGSKKPELVYDKRY